MTSCVSSSGHQSTGHSRIATIGTGFAGICVGVQFQRWYNEEDIVLFDRADAVGGTWYYNRYPGVGCDVPAPLYSYSFNQSASWSSFSPKGSEIRQYVEDTSDKYNLRGKTRFHSNVLSATWDQGSTRWVMLIEDLRSGLKYYHTCDILFACTGQFVKLNDFKVPGMDKFKGSVFHSARWEKSLDTTGKRIVVVGNGCAGAQLVAGLMRYDAKPASLTHVIRSKAWINEVPEMPYPAPLRRILSNSIFALWLLRWVVFLLCETHWPIFYLNSYGTWYRKRNQKVTEVYMREKAPAEFHEALIPQYAFGCKRRVPDPGYLAALHDPRVQVETARIIEMDEDSVTLANGRRIAVDVVVLCIGFQTNYFLDGINVSGVNGETLRERWHAAGVPKAYDCTALSGFPNFFIIGGPNATTGHTSTLMAIENSTNFALRILRPVIKGERKIAEVKRTAEEHYHTTIHKALAKRVWNTGCDSWYIKDGKNGMLWPWSQAYYWYRSLRPTWSDWIYR